MMKALFFSFIFQTIFEYGLAMCPNLCNANGLCSSDSVCTCFSGYTGPECNLRTCPYGYAWADKAYSRDAGHQYAECSGAGLCNRDTGDCECLSGFTGQACEKALCPNLCQDRGTCMTMSDMASFYGQDYDASVWSAGDGYGPTYTNWDKDATTLCNCDYGFFGPDCSQIMCPKGDDPRTDSQNYRQILLTVKDYDPFTGVLGINFQGETTFISLASPSSSDCETAFEASDKFDDVNCTYTALVNSVISFDLTFISWPKFPKENNLFPPHGGNPSTSDFTCDISRTDPNTVCTFTDVVNTQLREYEYCSNRGTCNFKTGDCTCSDGFGGMACERVNHIFTQTTDTGIAEQITVRSPDYMSTAYNIEVARSSDPDFYMLETFSDSKQCFYVRGDGEVGVLKANVWTAGMTVEKGGLTVEHGGLTVASDGAYFYNTDVTSPALSVHSTSEAFTGDTLKITTTATKTTTHNLIKGSTAGTNKFSVRGDGLMNVGDVGMLVTGGISVRNDGLMVSDGMTVYDSGLKITSGITIVGAATVTGGLSVASAGLNVVGGVSVFARVVVETGGVVVTGGGQTITAGGMAVVDGITIAQAGLTVTGSLSIHSDGFKVTGGVSINDLGLTITEGLTVESVGIKVDSGGMSISDGVKITDGLTVHDTGVTINSGATIVDTGLVVELGGLSVDSSGLYVTSGMTVTTGGLIVTTGGAGINGGVSVQDVGLRVTGGFSVQSTGLRVNVGGLSVNAGGMRSVSGLTVESGGLTVDASGMQAYNGLTLHDIGLKITGGLTVENSGLVITADGGSIRAGGMKVATGLTVGSGGVVVEAVGLEVTGGITLHDVGIKITSGITVSNTGLAVSANGATIAGNGMKVENGITLSDTGLTVSTSGMGVTGGLSLNNIGINVVGGVTVDSDGIYVAAVGGTVTAGSMQVAGGVTLLSGALKVDASGIKTTGGLSINNGGLVIPAGMGMTVVDTGLVVPLNGVTVTAGGMKVAGGVTVSTSGMFIENGGVKATGGLSVNSGGVTFSNGASLTVVDTGLVVIANGATISGGLKVTGGMTVTSGDLIAGSHVQTAGGMSVYAGARGTGGLTVSDTGMKVDTGGATFNGNLRIYHDMTVTGTAHCTTQTNPTSDRRLKTKITPLKNSLSDVSKLRGVYFKWDESSPKYNALTRNGTANERQLGLIAQDVEAVFPEAVHKILEGDYKGVSYMSLVPVLIEAVRELNDKYVELDIFSHELDLSTESCV